MSNHLNTRQPNPAFLSNNKKGITWKVPFGSFLRKCYPRDRLIHSFITLLLLLLLPVLPPNFGERPEPTKLYAFVLVGCALTAAFWRPPYKLLSVSKMMVPNMSMAMTMLPFLMPPHIAIADDGIGNGILWWCANVFMTANKCINANFWFQKQSKWSNPWINENGYVNFWKSKALFIYLHINVEFNKKNIFFLHWEFKKWICNDLMNDGAMVAC